MHKQPAIVLLSGGLDSMVAGAIAADTFNVIALTIEYGQPVAERKAALAIADHFGWPKPLCRTHSFNTLFGLDADPTSYFPGRNAIFLALALQQAEIRKAAAVVIGCNQDDAAEYPDCRIGFLKAFEEAAILGTRELAENFGIYAPLVHKTKREVVEEARLRKLPIEKSFSCYRPKKDDPCGTCLACLRRAEALA